MFDEKLIFWFVVGILCCGATVVIVVWELFKAIIRFTF